MITPQRLTNTDWRRVARWLGVAAVIVLAAFLWPERFGGHTSFTVVSGHSMEPTYHNGDLLFIRSARPSVGDVIVYRIPKGLPGAGHHVVHRVRALSANGQYSTKGDNRSTPDDAAPTNADIVGTPIFNLGPLPTRALALLARLSPALLALIVTTRLWPRQQDDGTGLSDVNQTRGRPGRARNGFGVVRV